MVRRTFIEDRKIAFDDINKYYDYPFYLNCIIRNYKIFLIDYKSVTDAIPEETYQQVFDSNLLSLIIKGVFKIEQYTLITSLRGGNTFSILNFLSGSNKISFSLK